MGRCEVCSGKYHQIPSDGPKPARIAVYAERPGQWEERNAGRGYPNGDLKCLIGPTGREYNELYLPLAGLAREEVFVGNVVQCGADNNRKPTSKEVQTCGRNHIPGELEEVQPEIVILMGATACSLIPEIDLEVQHGIPFQGKLYDWEGQILPIYHPALGLHEGSKMGLMIDDWEGIKGWLRGEDGKWPINNLKRDYRVCRTHEDLLQYYVMSGTHPILIGVDTETHGGRPYSIQFSLKVGTGRLILTENADMIKYWVAFVNHVVACGTEIVFHNHPADLPMVEGFGVHRFPWRDTMQEAYHLGLPQGLKALSYRLLGRKRLSWDETVTPASKVALYEWFDKAIIHVESNWRTVIKRTGKRGQGLKPKIEVSETERMLKSILNHMLTSEEYDPWAKIQERVGEEFVSCIEEVVGERVPVKGVAHLTIEELIDYACADSDDTLAIALELERRRGEFEERVGVREEDYDVVVRRD